MTIQAISARDLIKRGFETSIQHASIQVTHTVELWKTRRTMPCLERKEDPDSPRYCGVHAASLIGTNMAHVTHHIMASRELQCRMDVELRKWFNDVMRRDRTSFPRGGDRQRAESRTEGYRL